MRHRLLAFVLFAALAVLSAAQGITAKPGETLMVLTVRDKGVVAIRLHTKQAPRTTAHVAGLVERKFYDGQKFFKVVKEPRPFLVQFGDPGSRTKPMDDPSLGNGGSGTQIPFEDSGFSNDEGAVGLSTLPNDRDSGDSQFYIVIGPARFLDGNYTVFGKVVSGMNIVKGLELGDQVTSVRLVRG